jgi:Tol biopolymer transport system component
MTFLLKERQSSEAYMRKRVLLVLVAAYCVTAPSLHSQQTQPTTVSNWMTQAVEYLEVSSEPRIFGASVISTPDYEFNASFTPDGRVVYFSKSDPVFSRISVVQSTRTGAHWNAPAVAPFSGQWKDTDPFVSADGSKLFFASDRSTDGSLAARKDYDLWYVERSRSGWGAPVQLPATINTDDMDVYPSVAANGNLYFISNRAGGKGGMDIYRARWDKDHYAQPENLPFNTTGNDLDPVIAPDESFLVFVTNRPGGQGQGDLYVTFRDGDNWSAPRSLGKKINTQYNEIAAGISPDGKTLYFASNRVAFQSPRKTKASYKELVSELHGIENGLLNIYEVDISTIHELAPKH